MPQPERAGAERLQAMVGRAGARRWRRAGTVVATAALALVVVVASPAEAKKRKGRRARASTTTVVSTTSTTSTSVARSPRPPLTGPGLVAADGLAALPNGDVGLALEGMGWFAREQVRVTLENGSACPGGRFVSGGGTSSGNAFVAVTDFSGRFNLVFLGPGCGPGSYAFSAKELGPSQRRVVTSFDVGPATGALRFAVVPAVQRETGLGGVAVAVVAQGLPVATVRIASADLVSSCTSVDLTNASGRVPLGTDHVLAGGTGVYALTANGCRRGQNAVELAYTFNGGHTLTATLDVLGP